MAIIVVTVVYIVRLFVQLPSVRKQQVTAGVADRGVHHMALLDVIYPGSLYNLCVCVS